VTRPTFRASELKCVYVNRNADEKEVCQQKFFSILAKIRAAANFQRPDSFQRKKLDAGAHPAVPGAGGLPNLKLGWKVAGRSTRAKATVKTAGPRQAAGKMTFVAAFAVAIDRLGTVIPRRLRAVAERAIT
jgi:hypothetical protein